jgi:sulfur transfer complex TusBCD TusB component (DsrH family)
LRHVLYLVKSPVSLSEALLPVDRSADQQVAVILLQDGVPQQHIPAKQVYVLEDDAASRGIPSNYPTVSYADMLRMIFEADSVIAL